MGCAHSSPASEPVLTKAEPAKAEPAKAEPIKAEPAKAKPTVVEPTAVDKVPPTTDIVVTTRAEKIATPLATLPDSFYESMGLVKTGPVSWRTASPPPRPINPAVKALLDDAYDRFVKPPVATTPATESPGYLSKWQESILTVAPKTEASVWSSAKAIFGYGSQPAAPTAAPLSSRLSRVASFALSLVSPRSAGPADKLAEVRCPVCTFDHFKSCATCPRCGS